MSSNGFGLASSNLVNVVSGVTAQNNGSVVELSLFAWAESWQQQRQTHPFGAQEWNSCIFAYSWYHRTIVFDSGAVLLDC